MGEGMKKSLYDYDNKIISQVLYAWEVWEPLLTDHITKYHKLKPDYYDTILRDFKMCGTSVSVAKEYLDKQIADLKHQLSEQGVRVG
jgi:hypothetical protein